MKKLLLMLSTALMLIFTGCMQFDDTRIWDAIDELEDLYDNLDGRLEKLEEECEKMNTNIEALQTLVSALQAQDTITTIAPIKQGDKIIGYTISFSKSEPITIYHGEDGKDGADGEDGKDGANGSDGYTPTIGVAKDADENYYWTLDGEWLLDAEGNKIKANGNDGKGGADGEDGEDGITPKLEIRDGYWYISYDNGQSWVELGKATGEDGKDGANGADGADGEDGKDGENGKDGADGDSLFESVTWDEEYAYFTLSDGTVIKIPLALDSEAEEGDLPPANEIWYTSTDGEVVTPYWEIDEEGNSVFNANIISNTYENGVGIITFDGDVTSIGYGAFAMRTNLKSFIIPESVTEIGVSAFAYCSSLAEFNGKFASSDGRCLIIDGVLNSFAPAGLTEYTIPDSVTSIGLGAFVCCSSLASVTIPDSVTEIGSSAFSRCKSLTSVTIPNSVTSIGSSAFAGCTSLKSFYGKYASNDGRYLIIDGVLNSFAPAGLTEYTIPDSVTSIGRAAFFYCKSLTSVTIPDSVTSIGNEAFRFCTSLKSITIPEGVTSIGKSAFEGCTSLTSITIPEGVTSIGEYAFYKCTSLTSITIPDSVTSIVGGAFSGCISLTSVTIGNGVTSIGRYAFNDCYSLTSVYCKAVTPPAGDSSMFYNNASERKIYVPTESVDAYQTAPNWSDYADYIEPYNFGGGEGNAGVKEVAAVSLGGMWDMWQEEAIISGFISDKPFNGDFLSIDSWSYGFTIISDTEPINDEIPLGTYTYVDYEKIVNGEEELKAGTFVMDQLIDDDITTQCFYTNANGETQGFNYTEGVMVVSEGKIELTVTLENGEVHHVVYEGSLQTWGEGA